MENIVSSLECSLEFEGPTKCQTTLVGTSRTSDMRRNRRRSASPSLEQLHETSRLSQIRKSVQSHKYTDHKCQKGPFFSQRDSFDVGGFEETDSDDGELNSDNDEDIPGLRDMGRTRVEGTKGAY